MSVLCIATEGNILMQGSNLGTSGDIITGIAGNQDARKGDAQTGIKPIFDQQQVKNNLDASVLVTQTFGQQAELAVTTVATEKRAELQLQLDDAKHAGDTNRQAEIRDQISQINLDERVANVLIGIMSGQAKAAITQGVLSEAGDLMTQAQIKDSLKSPKLCDTQGNCVGNATGESTGGALGYMFKLGGGRLDFAAWCATGACTPSPDNAPTNAYSEDADGHKTYYAVNSDGNVAFNPVDSNKNPITMNQFIVANQDNPKIVSQLGGIQGGQGQFTIPLIGYTHVYQSGSLSDNIIEAYAGTHDALNSLIWYDAKGNDKNLDGTLKGGVGNVTNWTNVILATPVAASIFFTSGAWNAVNALMK
jgi:filamentous hemagglutinin